MKRLLAAIAALALSACVSSYTDGTRSMSGGFDQRQISEGVWQVSYFGNGYTNDETVQTYWLYRASEITLEQGYQGFQILSDIELTSVTPGEARFTQIVEHGRLDGKPFMVASIRLLHTPLPEAPRRVFDAATLKAFLEPYVKGELCGGNVCPHVHRYLFPGFRVEPTT